MATDNWYGLYKEGWQGEIVPEAFSHPAKFARGLIRRIYQHMVKEGWLAEGDVVVDPFAGVGLGGLDAMFYGLVWVGNELEGKFVDLGQQNIDLWNSRYGNGMLPRWGTAVLLQGDSRQLCQVLEGARARGIVASPPYVSGGHHDGVFNTWGGEIGKTESPAWSLLAKKGGGYGQNPSNLGNMREGDHEAAARAVVSSPPHIDTLGNGKSGIDWGKQADRDTTHPHGWAGETYGDTPGQLAAMPEGEFEAQAVVSSPPVMSVGCRGAKDPKFSHKFRGDQQYSEESPYDPAGTMGGDRNSPQAIAQREERAQNIVNLGQIVGDSGATGLQHTDTFWSAARQVVEQCYQLLAPGGHAVWVVKDFVRNKKRVPFCDQWRQMCEAAGFVTLHEHRCWLVEERGAQYRLDGDLEERVVERKSFFRRLAEKKGSPRIDYEVVFCMARP